MLYEVITQNISIRCLFVKRAFRYLRCVLPKRKGRIAQIIKALEEKGYLKREGRYSRTVHLLNRAGETAALQRWREIPIIGRVMAGLPMSYNFV